jgi:uncharacterized protein DUF5818
MSKTLMFAAVLLLSAAWLQAQQYPQSGSSPSGGTQTSSGQGHESSGKTTVEGCLQGSDGNFTLTDSSGATYQLQGDTSKLSEHVGHEVQIKGTTSGAAAGSSAGSQQTLNVDSVKHLGKTCKSAGK